MSREHHFEDVVNGCAPEENRSEEGQGSPPECAAKCASIATRNATPQASASGSTALHETTEPADTTRVTAGSSGIAPVTKTGRMAGTGFEPVGKSSGNMGSDNQNGTESGTLNASSAGLDALIDSWGLFTADDRRRILAIVNGRLA